jgi:hypothetical protein
MYADDLIEILRKLPPDTIICKTSGEDRCDGLESAKYFPQFNILYLEPYWGRKSKGYIDMADGDGMFFGQESRCPYSKVELATIRDLARDGKRIVDGKADGKMHRIQVVQTFAVSEDMCNDFALKVDGEYAGGQRGEGVKAVVCDFEWESYA